MTSGFGNRILGHTMGGGLNHCHSRRHSAVVRDVMSRVKYGLSAIDSNILIPCVSSLEAWAWAHTNVRVVQPIAALYFPLHVKSRSVAK
jgi:hypothetical protein